MKKLKCHHITPNQIRLAHQTFLEKEPRDLFYKAATHLVAEALDNVGTLTLAEAVSVLLQTWNRVFYQRRPFREQHLTGIENLFDEQRNQVQQYRPRDILSLSEDEEEPIASLFESFESVLYPVGAAKTLHLLAPKFFPIWDRKIASEYGLPLSRRGTNGLKYFTFAKCQKEQAEFLDGNLPEGLTATKAIDEYNYCHFSRRWI